MKPMRREAGFRPCSGNENSRGSDYSGFYKIGITGGGSLIGKIENEDEVEGMVYLLPHVVPDDIDARTGDTTSYRLEEETPTQVNVHAVTFRQPVSQKFVDFFLNYSNGHDFKQDDVRLG